MDLDDDEVMDVGSINLVCFSVEVLLVNMGGGECLLVIGGVIFVGDGCVPELVIELCELDSDNGIVCTLLLSSSVVMFGLWLGYCSLCLDDDPSGVCDRMLIFGGLGFESSGEF